MRRPLYISYMSKLLTSLTTLQGRTRMVAKVTSGIPQRVCMYITYY
jgi:hypothetical protein